METAILARRIECFALLICLGVCCWGSVLADGSAQLSGTVRAGGSAVADAVVVVTAFEAPGGSFQTSTSVDGSWMLEVPLAGLAIRPVYVEAASGAHAPARLGGAPDLPAFFGYPGSGALSLEPGSILTDLDIDLPPGGRLSGSVRTQADDAAVPGASVRPFANADGQAVVFTGLFHAVVEADGQWQSPLALPPGDYHLAAWPPPEQNRVVTAYNQIVCQWQSCDLLATDSLSLDAGELISNLDFRLASGARLSGQVLPSGGTRSLRLYDASGTRVLTTSLFASAVDWSFDGLAGGSYYLEIAPSGGPSSFLVRQLHNGLPCPFPICDPASGPPLTVAPGASRSGVNIVLGLGGRVSGTLIDADTGSAPSVAAGESALLGDYKLLDDDDAVVGVGSIVSDAGTIRLLASSAVPAGSYRLSTFDRGMGAGVGYDQPGFFLDFSTLPGYADALHPSAACAGLICDETAGTPVAIEVGTTTEDLIVGVRRGSSLRGRIVDDSSGEGIAAAVAVLVDADNRRYAAVRTDASGHFDFGAFPAGSYYLRTAMSSTFGQNRFPDRHAYFDRVWGATDFCSEQLCEPGSGSALVLDGSADVEGLELRVQAGPVIRGFVVDPLTRAAIGRGAVDVFDSEDRLVGRYVISGSDRQYQTTALPPGTYRLVAALSEAFAPLVLPPQSPRERSARSSTQPGVQFVSLGEDSVTADFLAVDRAVNELFEDRFEPE